MARGNILLAEERKVDQAVDGMDRFFGREKALPGANLARESAARDKAGAAKDSSVDSPVAEVYSV